MSRRRRHNATVLARRSAPYADAHDQSMRDSWDHRRREPSDLRECVRAVRKAYQDEVPHELHYGPDAIGDSGTPMFTVNAENYLFGKPDPESRRDPATGLPDALDWYRHPFRAALARMELDHDAAVRRRAAIVRHITLGQQSPRQAAMAERAHPDDAAMVAEHALRVFLRGLSDMKVNYAVRDPDLAEDPAQVA